MPLQYPFVATPDGDGFLITCPDLPEVTSDADTLDDAAARAADAIEEAIAGRMASFEDIPRPSAGADMCDPLDPYLSIKVSLFWTLHDRQETRAGLARLLGWHRNSVDRLFMPRHATKLDQFSAAFSALGARLDFEVRPG
ncbi:hypothetical protein A8B82_21100 [Sulfitobacter sp. EhC04]|nr:hypothetical protein A8B82_21100 [Sulfitobacter sp. EhC04]